MMALQGPLSETFETHARNAADAARLLDRDTLYGQASGSVSGLMKRGAAATSDTHNKAAEKAAKEAKQSADDILFIELMNSQQEQISDRQRIIDRFDHNIERLNSAIEFLHGGNEFELNADGSLKDVDLEEIISRFEEEHSVEINRNDPKQLRFIVDDIDTKRRDVIADRNRLIDDYNKAIEENPNRASELGIVAQNLSSEGGQERFEHSLNKVSAISEKVEITRSRDDLNNSEIEYAVDGITNSDSGAFFASASLMEDFGLAASGSDSGSLEVSVAPESRQTFPIHSF